jgi:hypothetical protein
MFSRRVVPRTILSAARSLNTRRAAGSVAYDYRATSRDAWRGVSLPEMAFFLGLAYLFSETIFAKWKDSVEQSSQIVAMAEAVPLWHGDDDHTPSTPSSGGPPSGNDPAWAPKPRKVPMSALDNNKH